MSEVAALTTWRTWVASEAAEIHIHVIIHRLLGRLPDSDRDDLTAEVQQRLLQKGARYDPAKGAPTTFGDHVIPRVLIDALRWLGRHCRDKRRAVRLSRLAPRTAEDADAGNPEVDPPEAEAVADTQGERRAARDDRDAAIRATLATLAAPERRFAERIMDGMAPRRAGAFEGWDWREVEAATERVAAALARAGVTAGDQ